MSEPTTYWSDVAKSLHEAADRFAVLADVDTEGRPDSVNIYISCGYAKVGPPTLVARVKARVDSIAKVFDATGKTKVDGRGSLRRAEHVFEAQLGPVRLHGYASVPAPPTRSGKAADLQRELDDARAELAELKAGGGPR